MPFHTHTLSNGLTLIGESSPEARSVALGFFVKTGARDETPAEAGVSHFLEHMMFKGTDRRTALEVNLDFDRIGADYNAYTSEENTVYHAAVLPEYLPQVVDVLADILRPSLREEDFAPEKEVVLTEIAKYEDQPGHVLYEHCRQLFYGTHKLGNSVLGTKESVAALTRDQMEAYFRRRYVPSNITVVITGQFEWDQFVGLVNERCSGWLSGLSPRVGLAETPGQGGFEVLRPKTKVAQEYLMWMLAGPPTESPLRYAGDLLATVLGDDPGGRLYWEIVDPGLAESADMGYQECEGAGLYYISIVGEPANAQEDLGLVAEVLGEVQREGITAEELEQARSKVLSRLVRGAERPKGRLSAVAYSWIYQHTLRTLDDELAAFRAVTLADVRELLDRYPLLTPTTVALGPVEKLERA
jgi:predicted Zn-dependent peptidase